MALVPNMNGFLKMSILVLPRINCELWNMTSVNENQFWHSSSRNELTHFEHECFVAIYKHDLSGNGVWQMYAFISIKSWQISGMPLTIMICDSSSRYNSWQIPSIQDLLKCQPWWMALAKWRSTKCLHILPHVEPTTKLCVCVCYR